VRAAALLSSRSLAALHMAVAMGPIQALPTYRNDVPASGSELSLSQECLGWEKGQDRVQSNDKRIE
jgi:hypothetical protein